MASFSDGASHSSFPILQLTRIYRYTIFLMGPTVFYCIWAYLVRNIRFQNVRAIDCKLLSSRHLPETVPTELILGHTTEVDVQGSREEDWERLKLRLQPMGKGE
jgi:hypothetical protein